MPIREFYTHLTRVNSDELPHLPPGFSADQSLGTDEIIDIVLFAIPNSWKKELDRQGKDPDELGETELIRLLEQFEAAETYDKTAPKPKAKTADKSPAKKAKKDTPKEKVYCEHHGWNTTHTSAECRVLKGKKDGKSSKPYKNKTWSRDKSSTKEELKLLILETMQELNCTEKANKKRKADESEDESSDEEEEHNLAELNYENMANLKLDD